MVVVVDVVVVVVVDVVVVVVVEVVGAFIVVVNTDGVSVVLKIIIDIQLSRRKNL